MDDKGEKCIFIGHNTKSKAYKLYNPETEFDYKQRHEVDEKDMWDWSLKSQQESVVIVDNHEENDERLPDPTPYKLKSSRRPQRNP